MIGLHPGDELGKELPFLFPHRFEKLQGTPILDTIYQRLEISDFAHSEVEVVNSMEYLHTPLDVIKLRCFGQDPEVYETVKNENLAAITKIFEQNTSEKGLPITYSRYLVRASV